MKSFGLSVGVLLLTASAWAAAPEVKSYNCVVEMKEFDTGTNQPLPENESNHTYDSIEFTWQKGNKVFSLHNRNTKALNLAPWDFTQKLKQTVATANQDVLTEDIEIKYFYDPKGVELIESRKRSETKKTPTETIISDVTYTDSSRNQGNVYVTQITKPDGSVETVTEQRDPSPADGSGIQLLSQKATCRSEVFSYAKVQFGSRIAKIKAKVEAFSKAIDTKSETDLLKDWRNLISKSDFRSETSGGGNSGGGSNNSGGSSGSGSGGGGSSNQCAKLQPLFDRCINHRANCWEYDAGGACYGVPNMWGQCTGIRPPILGCHGL